MSRQSGSASMEEQQAIESTLTDLQKELKEHKLEAARSLENYHEMTKRCKTQWKETCCLESNTERSADEDEKLQHLKSTFTLVLSADYQMGKLLPSWGRSPQPSSTYYFQKLTCDILGIVDHRDCSGAVYVFDERVGPKNTDHTISYILHYIKCEKVPSWVKRVHLFMDNAGSTNKNQYQMGAAMEIVQQNLLDFFRISFMVADHTKFDPDWLFSHITKAFNSADIFNITKLAELISQYASVTADNEKIVRDWRSQLPEKYTNLPGVCSLHDLFDCEKPSSRIFPNEGTKVLL